MIRESLAHAIYDAIYSMLLDVELVTSWWHKN